VDGRVDWARLRALEALTLREALWALRVEEAHQLRRSAFHDFITPDFSKP